MSGQFWVTVQCPVVPASLCSIGFKPDCLLVLGDDLSLDRQTRAGVHLYHSSVYCLQRSPSALLQGWGKAGETEVYSWK